MSNKNIRVYNESFELNDNALLKHSPELFREWDFEKNNEISVDIYKVTYGSHKIVWWNCPKCKSSYDMIIKNRTSARKSSCPFCVGKKVNHTNSLASLNPELAKEWHPTKNGELSAHDVTKSSNKRVWWLGECGHEWDAVVADRAGRGDGCHYCSGHKVLRGYNDVWTINPELASLLANPDDGYKYMQSSNVNVNWRCSECLSSIKNKQLNTVNRQGLCCPRCSDGLSFGEKLIYILLQEAKIDFTFDSIQKWSGRLRYDFHFEHKGKSYIIETHGIQHYEENNRGRMLEEEQKNDKLKYQLAKENGVDNYIVLDARESTVGWIKNSILNSDIMMIVEDIDFERIEQLSNRTFIKEVCNLWETGIRSTSEIARKMKLHRTTIVKYLKRGTEIGWCDYCPKEAMKLSGKKNGKSRGKCIVQLSMEGVFIKEWESGTEAGRHLSIDQVSISVASRGKYKSAGGFKWMLKVDYDNVIKERA